MSLYSFYAVIHPRPKDVQPGPMLERRGLKFPTLTIPSGEIGIGFDRTFEEVGELLARNERLFFEPDGSFVWTSSANEPTWQLDGMLYDLNGRVLYVDLKGSCPASRFDQLLTMLDWPKSLVVFQLVYDAAFVDEATFRSYAVAPTTV